MCKYGKVQHSEKVQGSTQVRILPSAKHFCFKKYTQPKNFLKSGASFEKLLLVQIRPFVSEEEADKQANKLTSYKQLYVLGWSTAQRTMLFSLLEQ